jgi:hypothetical protein
MSVDAIYKGRKARIVDPDYVVEGRGWVGAWLEYWNSDEPPFAVEFGDPELTVEPTDLDPYPDDFDEQWERAT